jgi:hypothetical protein
MQYCKWLRMTYFVASLVKIVLLSSKADRNGTHGDLTGIIYRHTTVT